MGMNPESPNNIVVLLRRASPYLTFAVIAILGYGLFQVYPVIFAAMIGLGVAVLANPTVDYVHEKLRLPRGVGAVLLGLFVFGGIAGLLYLMGNMIQTELTPLLERLPETINDLARKLEFLPAIGPAIRNGMESANVGKFISENVGVAFQGLQEVTFILGLLVFTVALAVYLVLSPRRYVEGVLSAFPVYFRPRVKEAMHVTSTSLRQWFFAQLISMAVIGALTALGLWLLGVKNWAVIGFFAFVLEFVPYLGPILTAFLAVVVTLGSDPTKALWVVIFFTAVQQAEGNFITPMVMKKSVELPPALLLVVALVFGSWFGIIGVFLAAPVIVVARSLYLETYARQMDEMGRPPTTGGPVELVETVDAADAGLRREQTGRAPQAREEKSDKSGKSRPARG